MRIFQAATMWPVVGPAEAEMVSDFIWDDKGLLVARIRDGNVFREADRRQIGTVRHGNLYDLSGILLGHLEIPGSGDGSMPEGLRRLLE